MLYISRDIQPDELTVDNLWLFCLGLPTWLFNYVKCLLSVRHSYQRLLEFMDDATFTSDIKLIFKHISMTIVQNIW